MAKTLRKRRAGSGVVADGLLFARSFTAKVLSRNIRGKKVECSGKSTWFTKPVASRTYAAWKLFIMWDTKRVD